MAHCYDQLDQGRNRLEILRFKLQKTTQNTLYLTLEQQPFNFNCVLTLNQKFYNYNK